jgi:hypothetical protein
MERRTLWSPEQMKKEVPPAPGPAVAVVLKPAGRRLGSMSALPILIRSAFVSAVRPRSMESLSWKGGGFPLVFMHQSSKKFFALLVVVDVEDVRNNIDDKE